MFGPSRRILSRFSRPAWTLLGLLLLPTAACSDGAVEADPQLLVGDPDAAGVDGLASDNGSAPGPDGSTATDDATVAADGGTEPQDGIVWTDPDAATAAGDGTTIDQDTAVGADGTVIWPDGTVTYPDGGTTGSDGSGTVSDGAVVATDGGPAPSDGGTTPSDGGSSPDATPVVDAGIITPDAGGPVCGNGICQPGEGPQNCPADCQTTGGGGSGTWSCGDAKCDIGEEFYCQQDCLGPGCGDGVCKWPETNQACPADCKSGGGGTWVCGDGKCDIGEQFYCDKDCAVPVDTDKCLTEQCSAELAKCQAKSGCMDTIKCLEDCGGGWSCGQKCLPGGPQSASEATGLLWCGQSKGCY